MPTAPDCEEMATLPAGGLVRANVASNSKPGRRERTPRQFGPTSRTLAARQRRFSSASAAAPAADDSPKPAVTTTMARTPAAMQSSAAASTPSAGMHTIARSTGAATSATRAWAGRPATVFADRLIG